MKPKRAIQICLHNLYCRNEHLIAHQPTHAFGFSVVPFHIVNLELLSLSYLIYFASLMGAGSTQLKCIGI
uniref:Uncharacterized protein n=1 Tax=Arundo donax TaxID=35708 RepID=A0A0A9HD03_ARUDO